MLKIQEYHSSSLRLIKFEWGFKLLSSERERLLSNKTCIRQLFSILNDFPPDITYDVADISRGNHDEEEDGPDHFSPHRHVKRIHVRTLIVMTIMIFFRIPMKPPG